jgi:threonine synthase
MPILPTIPTGLMVTDEEMLSSIPILARKAGICAEPAGVAELTGLMKLVQEKKIKEDDRVLVTLSGNGGKDRASFISLQNSRFPQINPSLSEKEEALYDSTLHS